MYGIFVTISTFCFSLYLVPPITFKKKLANQEVEEGNSVTLSCMLSKPGIPVEWRKGDETLKSGETYQIIQKDSTMELFIKKARKEDSGVYSCVCGDQKTKATIKIFGRKDLSFFTLLQQYPVLCNIIRFRMKRKEICIIKLGMQ